MGTGGVRRKAAAIVLLAVSVLTACGGSDDGSQPSAAGATTPAATSSSPSPSPSASPSPTRRLLGPRELTAGTCLLDPEKDPEIADQQLFEAVPCSKPHPYEFAARLTMAAGAFKSEASMQERAFAACDRAPFYKQLLKLNRKTPVYAYTAFYPQQESWDSGDRTLLCVLTMDKGGDLPRHSLLKP